MDVVHTINPSRDMFHVSRALPRSEPNAVCPTFALVPHRLFALALVLLAQLELQWPDVTLIASAAADRASRELRVVLLAGNDGFHEACVAEQMAYRIDT